MQRRNFLRSLGAAGTTALLPGLAFAQPGNALGDAAEAAYIYALPLIEMARTRAEFLKAGGRVGVFKHDRALTTPATQTVTTPNTDTLYSNTWCDTAHGPITLTLPKTGARYISVAFLDMFTNDFAVLGTRTTGGDGGTFTLIGPDAPARTPSDIRSPTRWAWVLVRLLIDGPEDLARAHALQDRIQLVGPSGSLPPSYATREAEWPVLLASAQALIAENGVPATDGALFRQIAPLGIGPHGGFDAHRFSAADGQAIAAGLERGRTTIRTTRRRGGIVDHWTYPQPDCGLYGQDYFYRAQVALGGLGALPKVEAMYMRPLAEDGKLSFAANRDAVLHFAADRLPPVDGFWSATMYEVTPAGQFFFTDNAMNRYAIGDRTPGLRYNADKSLDIWMTRERPSDDRAANWLPTPAGKPWGLVFRTYLPKADLLQGSYTLPPVKML